MKKKIFRPTVREFIELYKRLPCLWKVESKDYANRPMKNEAYKLLAKKLAYIEPGANRSSVIKKINNLRSNYRKEKRKIRAAELNGLLFEPTLWYYNLLEFLDRQDDSDIDIIPLPASKAQHEDDDDTYSKTKFDTFSMGSTADSLEMASCHDEVLSRQRKCDDTLSMGNDDQFRTSQCEDQHDAFGRSIACKLRALPGDQRIYAEKIINEAIFEAELGTLNRSCRVQLDEKPNAVFSTAS